MISDRFCGEAPRAGNISGVGGGCGRDGVWKDFPGTERICEGVVTGVPELRRGRVGSADGVGPGGRGRVEVGAGLGGVGRSGRLVCVEGGKVDDNVAAFLASCRTDLNGIAGVASVFFHGDAPVEDNVGEAIAETEVRGVEGTVCGDGLPGVT